MILITGGAGFIGSTLVRQWLAEQAEPIVVADALTYAGSLMSLADVQGNARFFFERLDVCDGPAVAAMLHQYRPRAIVHLAAETHVDRSIARPSAFIQSNIIGTERLLEAALAYWQGLSHEEQDKFRYVQVSTDEVYGDLAPDAHSCDESAPYRPSSPYAASKAAADHLVMAWHRTYGLPVLISHCTNNYGPRQYPEKLIPRLLTRALEGKALPLYGDGTQTRDWLHVEDHARALWQVLACGAVGEHYNIGAHHERSNRAVVQELCALLDRLQPRPDGRSYLEQVVQVTDRPGHDRRYAVDSGKVQALGWRAQVDWTEGLEQTMRWYLQHLDWVEHMLLREK